MYGENQPLLLVFTIKGIFTNVYSRDSIKYSMSILCKYSDS